MVLRVPRKVVSASVRQVGRASAAIDPVIRTTLERIVPSGAIARITVSAIRSMVSVRVQQGGPENGVTRSVNQVDLDKIVRRAAIAAWSTHWLAMLPREDVSARLTGVVYAVRAVARWDTMENRATKSAPATTIPPATLSREIVFALAVGPVRPVTNLAPKVSSVMAARNNVRFPTERAITLLESTLAGRVTSGPPVSILVLPVRMATNAVTIVPARMVESVRMKRERVSVHPAGPVLIVKRFVRTDFTE